ncbi:hypothetical protein HW115_16800 [Verrucomicrobiaceae bacterium N1E253]|uniref:SGNH/GDSL hydrolase family protein n=1 Tax=Oceaniferula marina TaxID=2748318 RepID=A0A851GIE2_9BACT|nr:DUF4886 domain-containing protein [Oceaniferula marina]NWK57283.1 hypothetical protein [Oceaniferula marina]
MTLTAKGQAVNTPDAEGRVLHQALVDRVKKAKPFRVLFVGNSYSFKIPKQFAKIAEAEGRNVEVSQVTKGGWTMKRHAKSEETLGRIGKGNWDVVVLQEQSQIPSFEEQQRKKLMDPAVKSLVKAIRDADAIPVLFLTWGRKDGDKANAKMFPSDSYQAMQQRLQHGYRQAAKAGGGVWVVPVGEVWSRVRKAGDDVGLYAKDGSHPAAAGNFLGACVFYSAFYDQEVKQTQSKVPKAKALKQAAASVRLSAAGDK